MTICKTDVAGKLEKFRPNPLKFNFRAMVVTVCSMEKSSEYPLLKIPVKKLGLGHDISFANGDRSEGSGEAVRRFVTLNYQLSYGHY